MRMPCDRPRWFWLMAVGLLSSPALFCAGADQPRQIDFDRQIRPILSENCYYCHGPDASSRQADLRLDLRDSALAHGAIIPGQADASEIIQRLRSDDPDVRMPPPKSNRSLTPAQQELLARWINEGAAWSEHWAFVAPQRPALPSPNADWPAHGAIDVFLQKHLADQRLAPASEADRARLLRRVTLDLTGLPPTLEELDVFLADQRPEAYEQAVERLLASPRFGERMLWSWLDAARYADTNGYQGDPTRSMWYWRDWALAAINDNMPFDQFTIEQLAGDLLPNPTREQLIATGFHRNHMINGEGGRIAEESRIDYVQDRVETTGTVWLGLTLNCCRCHDHKFDALSQKEYYQLAAYFNSLEESGANDAGGLANPVMSLASAEQQARLEELRTSERAAQQALASVEQTLVAGLPAWEESLKQGDTGTAPSADEIVWQPLTPTSLTSLKGSVLAADGQQIIMATGPNPEKDVFSLLFAPPAGELTAIRLEALPDPALVNQGPGRADNGNFVLSELTVEIYGRAHDLEPVKATFEQSGWTIAGVIDGKPDTGWAIAPQFGEPHAMIIAFKTPTRVSPGEVMTVRLAFESPHVQHVLGKFRLSVTTDRPEKIRGLPANVREVLAKASAERNDAEQKVLRDYYLANHPERMVSQKAVDQAKSQREGFERSLPRTMVMRDRKDLRTTNVLVRGAYDKPADEVKHGVPAVLPALPADAPANRLALAQWLVAREHPLTARVVVNRFWQNFFGVGLVKTVEDFGVQGEKPVHPELLDWLAVEFVESGWDVKHLVRLMVTSHAYRQSSVVSAELRERDPENRWLARGSRQRWPSWMLRDQALAVSGLLVEQLGGPPVKGYQPAGIWEEATFGKIRYEQDHGAALYRRSLYQFWRRIVGPTVFFDVASRQNCTVKVALTNTPLQALVTLNDTTYIEAARVLAERICREAPGDATSRLNHAFRLCTSRRPTDQETERLFARYEALVSSFRQHPEQADELVHAGEAPIDASAPVEERAAWTAIALLLLNLDETLSKE